MGKRMWTVSKLIYIERYLLLACGIAAILKLCCVFVYVEKPPVKSTKQCTEPPHWIDNMLSKAAVAGDWLLDNRDKYLGIYGTWAREDSHGWKYVTERGICQGNFGYNSDIGNSLPVNRDIPDTRPTGCKAQFVDLDYDDLPSVSVVIPFHNEQLSTILRTIHSVLKHSHPRLLAEVILVDDGSSQDLTCLGEELERAIFTLNKVRLIRTTQREGSTKARIYGAAYATADILVYIDSHVEVNRQWLEPIVVHVQNNRNTVVMAILDSIDQDTFKVIQSYNKYHGGFNWNLEFYWKTMPERIQKQRKYDTDPIPSPIMPAGAFALDRKYYMELGLFDPDMKIWGVDDVEFSFRVWQCGGRVEILPCSRVAHIFRRRIPYSFQGDASSVIYHNAVRTAEVALGPKYKKFFYAQAQQKTVNVNRTSLRTRQQLRENLHCRDFDWFLDNVIPEMPKPPDDAVYYEHVKMSGSDLCLTIGSESPTTLTLADCEPLKKEQIWYLDISGHLVLHHTHMCLTLTNAPISLQMSACNSTVRQPGWRYDSDTGHLSYTHGSRVICLHRASGNNVIGQHNCDTATAWQFTYHFDWSKPLSY